MGRSVDYLNRAIKVNYFSLGDDEDEDGDGEFAYQMLVEDIVETIKSEHPEFSEPSKKNWDGKETRILLEGYNLQIGLSEYCGLWSLSVRVHDESIEYASDEEEYQVLKKQALDWIETNWEEATKYWNDYRKVGTFSNGEGVYESVNKTN